MNVSTRPAAERPAAERPALRRLLALATIPLALSLTACFSAAQAPSGTTGDARVSVAHLQPPRSGLTPLSDDAFKLSRWATAETLVVLDAEGNPLPGLATEWQRVDDKTWRLTIRPGVKFHNGHDLTAKAVVNSLQHAIDAKPLPRILDGVDMKVKADGDHVVITTGSSDPLLPNRLSSPQLAILDLDAYQGKTVSPVGTGTGPFELVKVDGIVGATLNRFEGYWGEKAKAGGIDVTFVPDGTARAAALRTGEAQVVEAIPVGQAATISPDLIAEVPMPRTNTLYLNTEKGPFKDPAVRAAAREALDTAAIVKQVYEGRADVAQGLLGPALPYAAGLRTEAAYTDILAKRPAAAKVNGVKITLGTFTDRAELPEVAVMVEQALEAAGFEVQQDVREYQFIEADALDGKFDAFILSRATVIDSGDPVAYMASDFGCKGGFAISQLCDPDVEAALKKASETDVGEARQRAIMAAEARILATDAAIPMLHERVIQGEVKGVVDAARDPRERILITNQTRFDAAQ